MAERDAPPTGPRLGRWGGPLAVGLLVAGVLVTGAATLVAYGGVAWAYDFSAYLDAAARLTETGSPYQPETLSGPFRPGPRGLYLYSPVLAVALLPVAGLDAEIVALAWLLLRVLALVAACALMPVGRNVRLVTLGVALLSLPVIDDLRLGNVSLLVTLLAVVAWRWLDRPAGSVAVTLGVALRPTLGIVLAWWLLRGRARPFLWTVASGLLLVLVTLPFVGVAGYLDYLAVLRNLSGVMGVPRNVDLGSAALLLGASPGLASAALLAGFAVAVTALLFSLRRDRELSFVVTIGATLLLSPLLWGHYLTLLLIPAAFLASRGHAWGLLLPLLGWLPEPLLPVAALGGMLLPFAAPPRGEPAASGTALRRHRASLRAT
ncbi:MAG TPA: glycosyltransferase 87 family protein [Candidatus Limnocylindria bacterium]|nr:glycosyltransferase 87 family protein [Candidatus Limnocylindria bacterium]